MRVASGESNSFDTDLAVAAEVADGAAETAEPTLCVWYPRDHVAFGPRDAGTEGFKAAREAVHDRGYVSLERSVGGRAVAFTGDVLAVVLAEPADATDPAIQSRYERTLDALAEGLGNVGASVRRGEPRDSFCPGSHSLQTAADPPEGGKIAGLAQRVRRDVAVVAGAVVVRDADTVADVLAPVYDALGVAFDRNSVGSVAAAQGEGDVDRAAIRDEIETALVGDRPTDPLNIRDT